jgi:hypothetical protein
VKSNVGRSVDPRRTDDSVAFEAGKIIERATPGGDAATAESVIEMQSDVRLTLEDGPIAARADRAIVTVRYQNASRTTVESVTVELRGGVQGSFDGIGTSADALTLSFRPSAQSKVTEPRQAHWTVGGRARLKGKDFVARADRVELMRDDDEAQETLLVKLEGNAALKYVGKSWIQGQRFELRPHRNSLGMVGAPPRRN